MRHEILGAAASGLSAGLSEEQNRSYDAGIKRLYVAAAQLGPQGLLLESMGELAPPCVALPYAEMREKLQDAAAMLMDSAKTRMTPEQFEKFTKAVGQDGSTWSKDPDVPLSGPLEAIFNPARLPELKVYWSDAPSKWWAQYNTAHTYGRSIGKLGETGDGPPLPPGDPALDFPTEPTEPVVSRARRPPRPPTWANRITSPRARSALRWAQKVWKTPVARVLRKGMALLGKVVDVAFVLYVAYELFWPETKEDAPPSVNDIINSAMDWYNDQYIPEVSQQLQAMIDAAKIAAGNPAKLRQAMIALDPTKYTPIGTTPEGGGIQAWPSKDARPPISIWPAATATVLGTAGMLAAGRE